MKNSPTAFLTTVFPLCENYLDDFFKSLVSQTDNDFDLIIVNDGFKKLPFFIAKYTALNIIEVISNNTPIQNRIAGLNYVLEKKYENLIFGDSDDYFAENRVEVSKSLLLNNDIVVNELILFNELNRTDSIFKDIKFSTQDLVEKNIFGLSNTAIKTTAIRDINLEPITDVVAYDWYLFSLLVFKGFTFKFTSETYSYYRQYELNTLGISFKLNEKNLYNLIRVKKMHLQALKKHYIEINNRKYYLIFEKEQKTLQELEGFLEKQEDTRDYLFIVNKHIDQLFSGWFSQLISIKKYKSLYESTN